jgi:hypothetical protein
MLVTCALSVPDYLSADYLSGHHLMHRPHATYTNIIS